MKQLFNYLKKYKLDTIMSVSLVSISAFCSLAIPRLLETVINDGIMAKGGPDQSLMEQLGIVMITIAIIGLVTGLSNSFFTAKLSQNVGADMRNDGFKKIQEFSYQDIEKFKTSNLVVRLTNDINQIQTVIMASFSTLLRAPILLIGSFILAMVTLPQLWYVILLLFLAVLVIIVIVASQMIPKFGKFQALLDKINGTIKENFIGARVVKSFVQEENEEKKFDDSNEKIAVLNQKIGNIFSIVLPAMMLVVNLVIALAIYLSANLAVDDVSVLGSMVSYINYLSQIMMSLVIGAMVLIQVTRSFVSLKRFNEILETKPSITYKENDIKHINGEIEFKNVTFTYPDQQKPSLIDINLKINKGEKIGIIGATGSGKSTLVHLLLRLFDVSEGELLIDNKNIKEIPKNVLRNEVSIVLQKPILFSGTIEKNITSGNSHDEKSMVEAAKAAQAAEFIEKLTGQYNYNVLQRGSNFSGGQKQRLSIARGLMNKPPILVLDDSTSALDARSEKLVKEALFNNYDNQTILIIAQKITSIIDADKIIVLDEGHLSGFDTHKNLLKTNKVYQNIYETYKGGDHNEK